MRQPIWKCLRCGGLKARTTRETVPFGEAVPNVTLVGVEVTTCAACGNREVAISNLDDLLRAVANALVNRAGRLTGDEIRFLRTFFGLSGGEFAALMDSTPGTVSRWENGKTPVGRTAEVLLRSLAVPITDPAVTGPEAVARARASLDVVRALTAKLDEPATASYTLAYDGKRWHPATTRASRAAEPQSPYVMDRTRGAPRSSR